VRVGAHCRLARAKLNLGLAVLAREASGFHQIETLFCALELADDVELTLSGDGVRLTMAAPAGPAAHASPAPEAVPDLGPEQENLACRAAAAFFRHTGAEPRVAIRLIKRIPAGAGLGGGSSDAAAVLAGLNTLHGGPVPPGELLRIGAGLGSDVPFFMSGSAFALAWGRGNRMVPLPPLPPAPVLLAVPPVPVATADAYAELARCRGDSYVAPPAILDIGLTTWEQAAAHAKNDFEDVVFKRMPVLAELREEIAASGAVLARMTGTGSTVFGVYRDYAAATRARRRLARGFTDVRFLLTRTLAR
jgi:4-diphosphocytidyl-2-C-methyl-D-erythritol kinase